jgi:metallo-beta-lactamase family protein
LNRKGQRAGKELVKPLYTLDDANASLEHFKAMRYDEEIQLTPEVKIVFRDAGHIIGSSIVEMYVAENNKTTKLVFSGDIGQPDQPIIKDPTIIQGADYVLTEATYGNRVHMHYYKEDTLVEIIEDTIARGGNVIIPAFAVGRTQTMLYYLHKLWRDGRIEPIPVIVDSPLAIAATKVFAQNTDVYDEESTAIVQENGGLPDMPHLQIAKTMEESRALNNLPGSKIIISASGMADAGRILHHLKHNLWRPESSVVFVGYQAEGSMGRRLLEGIKRVKIMGEEVHVKAKIYNLEGFSAHADCNQIISWLGNIDTPKPRRIFIVHGEADAAESLAGLIKDKLDVEHYIPEYGDIAWINGSDCNIEKSSIVVEPVSKDLEEFFSLVETDYKQLKKRLRAAVLREPDRLKEVTIKLEKAFKYLKKLTNDL